ncbi:DNA glycosylase AlkZ-like family protein [Micromonospora sp. NPDC000663]|uniref:DNA glycosylase AlkZ-like family protein n=1 Tax=Micromonospora sp. NPDC000663 TaxID=3364218 RepID=UPI00367D5324
MPAYDNALLGHADRTRIISDEDRKQVMPGRALVHSTILVDGFVRGTWTFTGDDIRLAPFRPLAKAEQQAVDDEANRMLPFLRYREPERRPLSPPAR